MHCAHCLLLVSALTVPAGCHAPPPDPTREGLGPLTPETGRAPAAGRAVLAEFTIHFDQHGGAVEVTSADPTGVPTAAARLMNATTRQNVPGTDVLLETLLAYLDPVLGSCVAGDWGYEVRLTNDGVAVWHSPIAQLTAIIPPGVTSCNTVDTGLGLPGGGVAVAEFPYGVSLDPSAAATAHWCFDPAGATDFTVTGRITVGDGPPTCGGLPLGDPGLCSGHGDCLAQDYCECNGDYIGDTCATCGGVACAGACPDCPECWAALCDEQCLAEHCPRSVCCHNTAGCCNPEQGFAWCEENLTEIECTNLNGSYKLDTSCTDECSIMGSCCDWMGFCCHPEYGSCEYTTNAACQLVHGRFTEGTTCEEKCGSTTGICCDELLSCCLTTGWCEDGVTSLDCDLQYGLFKPGTTCDEECGLAICCDDEWGCCDFLDGWCDIVLYTECKDMAGIFKPQLAGTCNSHCAPGVTSCKDNSFLCNTPHTYACECHSNGPASCHDVCTYCPVQPGCPKTGPTSCHHMGIRFCGGLDHYYGGFNYYQGCYCDPDCISRGDCCDDACAVCGVCN